VQNAVKEGKSQYVQLNPENTFCLQGLKEDWVRFAVPLVASCLESFSKKVLISSYEKSMLNFGMRSFLHVKVGEKDSGVKIDKTILDTNVEVFKNALSGFPLAVTNWMVSSEFKFVDTKTLFDKNKFREVNSEILSAGGLSAVIVSGDSEGSTSFASAQISLQTAVSRIKYAQNNFAEMMNKINLKLAEELNVTSTKIPEFVFNDVDLANDGKFKEACFKLWQQGMLSNQSLFESYEMDYEQEKERKKKEIDEGDDKIFVPPINPNTTSGNDEAKPGTPKKPVNKSKQDKNNSQSNPKPSTQ